MFQIGPMEIVVVAIIALLVLGPARLPGAAKAVGKGVREFKSALTDDEPDDRDEPERRAIDPAKTAPPPRLP